MEYKQLSQIYLAIKTDNLKQFTESTTERYLNLSFGRFPILSLCYLYQSSLILSKYESKLQAIKISEYSIDSEPLEIYDDFRKKAAKTLRLYPLGSIVTPAEMLAILGCSEKLNYCWANLDKNFDTIEKIKKIYSIKHQAIAQIEGDSINLPKIKNNGQSSNILFKFAIIALCFCLFCASCITCASEIYGLGRANKPLIINNLDNITTVSNKNLSLAKDTAFDGECIQSIYSLNGNNHKIELNSLSFLDTLNGVLENVHFVINVEGQVTQLDSALIKTNAGTIKNVTIEINGQITEVDTENDLFISPFVGTNDGEIIGCTLTGNVEIIGNAQGNANYSGIATTNNGTIKDCVNKDGKILSKNVDLSAVCNINNGIIQNTENNFDVLQTVESDIDSTWNPNCVAFCITNNGMVENCANNGDIKAISNSPKPAQIILSSFAINNYGSLNKCVNNGNITANSQCCDVFIGGIACFNYSKFDYAISNYANAKINSSTNYGDIFATNNETDENLQERISQILCGGIASLNQGDIEMASNKGKQVISTNGSVTYLGGLVSLNTSIQESTFSSNYSNILNCKSDTKIDVTVGNKMVLVGGLVGRNECGLRNSFAFTDFNIIDNNVYEEGQSIGIYAGTVAGIVNISYNILLGTWSSGAAYNSGYNQAKEATTVGAFVYNNSVYPQEDTLNKEFSDKNAMINYLIEKGIYWND